MNILKRIRTGSKTPIILSGPILLSILLFFTGFVFCDTEQYYINLNQAFDFYSKGDYEKASEFYTVAIDTAAGFPEENMTDAYIGLQNSLVMLKKHQEALTLGDKMLKKFPENPYLLTNSAFSSYALGQYTASTEYYLQLSKIDSKNKVAASGLAWSYYCLGKTEEARVCVKQALILDPADKNLKWLKNELTKAFYVYNFTGFYGLTGYSSPVKKASQAQQFLFTFEYRLRHRLDFSYRTMSLGYVLPPEPASQVPELNENQYTMSYSLYGKTGLTLTGKKIITFDTTLGNADLFFIGFEKKGLLLAAAYSGYEKSDSIQGEIGYRYSQEKYYLTYSLVGISRNAIQDIAPRKKFLLFSMGFKYTKKKYNISLGYTLGASSLLVTDYGFVAYNAPDELNYIISGGLEYTGKIFSAGYILNYSDGRHYAVIDPAKAKFNSLGHTLKFGLKF